MLILLSRCKHLEVPMRTYVSGAKIGSFPDSCKSWSVKSSFSPLFLKEFRLFLNEICLFLNASNVKPGCFFALIRGNTYLCRVVRVLIARAEVVKGRTIVSTAGNREPLASAAL